MADKSMTRSDTNGSGEAITFYFDPACIWTWVTSRWLNNLVEQGKVSVEWKPFSLSRLNRDKELSAENRVRLAASTKALRVIAALLLAGEEDKVASFYSRLGRAWFVDKAEDLELALRGILVQPDLEDYARFADDPNMDEEIARYHDFAFSQAGPDVGSPILTFVSGGSAFYGPIMHQTPSAEEGVRLLEAVKTLAQLGAVYEIKRGRTTGPEV
ncbi:MAG: hypothetical protein HKL81_05910 [Acidimicrobiaceae bacterium]|nr:hypothetical protein [Acidimicrobiaceae bacterium]